MSSIAMKSTVRKNGVEITRLRVIPKNKYSEIYREHKANIDAGKRPAQDCFESESGMTIIKDTDAPTNP